MHQALDTVLWQYHQPNIETAIYRDANLKVIHASPGWSIGYADGCYVGSASSMPCICEKLFTYVDAQKSKDAP